MQNPIPLTLYIHFPWCVKKCPYCDFNSHQSREPIPFNTYIKRLITDLNALKPLTQERPLKAIFLGGGTPSLFPANALKPLFQQIKQLFHCPSDIEITLEANPGTVDIQYFHDYAHLGINRLSIGVQSFHDAALKKLGRIHNAESAKQAVHIAKKAGFQNINIDIMYGLPEQSLEEALEDLNQAIALLPTHISWYQLTIEPNTLFYKTPPPLPAEKKIMEMQKKGKSLLKKAGFKQYEISAYAQKDYQCQHNLNYWRFADYLGIGAGAHGKLTLYPEKEIIRTQAHKVPQIYLKQTQPYAQKKQLNSSDQKIEFMLNTLRLYQSISFKRMQQYTQLTNEEIMPAIKQGIANAWLKQTQTGIITTAKGKNYLNDLLLLFMDES